MTGTAEKGHKGRIVVGVDGSAPSKEALRWAARQAQLTWTRVEAVTSWAVGSTAYAFPVPMPMPTAYDMGPAVEAQLNEVINQVRSEFPGIEISGVVRQGGAGGALIAAAEGADLLVVGSRGHGAVVGLLLGSVSEYCVTHAPCPVVVVRHGKDPVVATGTPVGASAQSH
jgi:nucleotide-binding universal stress UspA family protein